MILRQQHVHRRDDEQREQRADGKPGENHDTHRVTAGGACACRNYQRYDAQHHRRGRHQDRAQAHSGGFLDRLALALAGAL